MVINSPARNGWGETAQALHGEIAQVDPMLWLSAQCCKDFDYISNFCDMPLALRFVFANFIEEKNWCFDFRYFVKEAKKFLFHLPQFLARLDIPTKQQDRSRLSLDFAIIFFLAESWTSYFLFRAFLFSAKLPGFYFLFPLFPISADLAQCVLVCPECRWLTKWLLRTYKCHQRRKKRTFE